MSYMFGGNLLEHERGNGSKTHRVFYDPIDVLISAEDKRIALRAETLSRQPAHRRIAKQNRIGIVPVLLGTLAKEIDIINAMGATNSSDLRKSRCSHFTLCPFELRGGALSYS
jgi:hypothetical protein